MKTNDPSLDSATIHRQRFMCGLSRKQEVRGWEQLNLDDAIAPIVMSALAAPNCPTEPSELAERPPAFDKYPGRRIRDAGATIDL